ncbi:MAG TPA: glycosyltransferase family 1 protein [Patescibacteria group bacterium]|nr:glycosyltransferase family 1 protein [Patescibacteria group bacterium]
MRIGIDARLIEETGVGRYIRNLIIELGIIDHRNDYVVFLRKKSFGMTLPDRWEKRLADVHWHTVSEQFVMPKLFSDANLDLVHIPYHNPPILYSGNMVVTIHDLTILHFDTGKATTLPIPLYTLKRLGYWSELMIGLRRARSIIAVSQRTKQEISDHIGVDPQKITVTYEAAEIRKSRAKRLIEGEYILYVGNAYPHKNLETLLDSWNGTIVLATPDDYFSKRLPRLDNVVMFGPANAEQLSNLYTHAAALVFPSLMEGFGLPGLEAMCLGTPVVCSDIGVFREVYGEACLRFDPKNPKDIRQKIQKVFDDKTLLNSLIEKGKKQAAKYSWRKMAEDTLRVYEGSIGV